MASLYCDNIIKMTSHVTLPYLKMTPQKNGQPSIRDNKRPAPYSYE